MTKYNRSDFIEKCQEILTANYNRFKGTNEAELFSCTDIFEYVESLMPKDCEWVSVEDRLPTKHLQCLVINKGEVLICKYCHYDNMQQWDIYDPSSITHWQPLPTPPTK